jgi:hypothetical protein
MQNSEKAGTSQFPNGKHGSVEAIVGYINLYLKMVAKFFIVCMGIN